MALTDVLKEIINKLYVNNPESPEEFYAHQDFLGVIVVSVV